MNLQEQIFKIQTMIGVLTESMDKLAKPIQKKIDETLEQLKFESEEWDMDMMDEEILLKSIESIEIQNIVQENDRLYVGVVIYTNGDDEENFEDIIRYIEHGIRRYVPNIELVILDIVNPKSDTQS
jgi:hypothetical protein